MLNLRILDIAFSFLGLAVLSPLLIAVYLLGMLDTGSPVFFQRRVGRHQKVFTIVKFRTMRVDSASVPTHLINLSVTTAFGRFLRRTKLDELPQLWNVLKGDMSLVGPRPGLPSQDELTKARAMQDVYAVKPGITGLAQIKGIDMSTPELLARTDAQMIAEMSVTNYFRFIFLTVVGNGRGDRIKQK
jgi:lipopolysaccharide/colanic/teichoic acid biosynthesis glycosyltransferase